MQSGVHEIKEKVGDRTLKTFVDNQQLQDSPDKTEIYG